MAFLKIPRPFSRKSKREEQVKVTEDLPKKRIPSGYPKAPFKADNQKGYKRNSHVFLRVNNKKKKKRFKLPNLNPKFKKFLLIFLFVIFVVIGGIFLLLKTEIFFVREITVVSSVNLDTTRLEEDLLGRNLFMLSVNKIEDSVKKNFKGAKEVYVRKVLPDRIEIEITLQEAKYVLLNFNDIYVVDAQFGVIESETLAQPFFLDEFQLNALYGFANADSKYIEEIVRAELTSEELKEFKWVDYPIEKKTEKLNQIKLDSEVKLKSFKQNVVDTNSLYKEYSDVQVVFFWNGVQLTSDPLYNKYMEYTTEFLRKMQENSFVAKEVNWASKASIEIILDDDRRFYFTITRPIENQLEAFDAVVFSELLSRGNKFDFRTDNYSISD